MHLPVVSICVALVVLCPRGVVAQQNLVPTIEVGERVLVSGDLPDTHHSEPHLAVDPTDANHLLAAVGVFPDSGRHRVDALVSFDGGRSWERSLLPGLEDTEALDPWVAFGPEGRAVVTALIDDHDLSNSEGRSPAGIAVFRSPDGGLHWEGPSVVPYGLGESYDQQKVGVDLSDGPYRGRFYIAAFHWGPRTRPGNVVTASLGLITSHNARTFHGPVEISSNNVNKASVQPVVLVDGTVLLLYRAWGLVPNYERTDLLWVVNSTDGGETFSPPFLVSAWAIPGFADAATGMTGPAGHRVYAAWLEELDPLPRRTSAADPRWDVSRILRLAYSDARGAAWSNPLDLAATTQGTRLVIFRIAVDGLGNVAVAWVEDTEPTDTQCHELLVRISSDGGQTFSPPTPLADPACHPLPGESMMYTMGHEVAPLLPRFGRGGDYFGLVGLPEGGFSVLWSAAEDGVLRLFSAEVGVGPR